MRGSGRTAPSDARPIASQATSWKARIVSRLPISTQARLRSLRAGLRNGRRVLGQSVLDCAPDAWIQTRNFRRFLGQRLNLRRPQSFNEKLHWLMLNYRRPELTELADKYRVRDYVAARAGAAVLNELYGAWDDPDAIPFERLPDAFVLKVTSAWGQNIFCRDKSLLDIDSTRRQLATWMRRSGYWAGREWAYKHIRPRVIAERLLTGDDGGIPTDYKVFCFGGRPRFVQVDTDRFTDHRRDFFDTEWRLLPFSLTYPPTGRAIPAPRTLPQILSVAATLSTGFPFVRIDLYSIGAAVIFGEMTWYPEGGLGRFAPESYDLELGKALVLPAPVSSVRQPRAS
jgi:hypothetical protein